LELNIPFFLLVNYWKSYCWSIPITGTFLTGMNAVAHSELVAAVTNAGNTVAQKPKNDTH
jgi:hypothetical protein